MRKDNILTAIKRLVLFGMLVAGINPSFAAQTFQSNEMGLSKESVFNIPTPPVYHYGNTPPGASKVMPRAYLNAPPQVPHDISSFLPITTLSNACVACHSQRELWGKKREPATPTPIPPSHYTDLRKTPAKVGDSLVNARFNCNQCHVPQTNARPLVENTFSGKRK